MSAEADPVFDCPYCGQGGLAEADILATPPVEAVVCQECDRVWLSPNLVGFDADGCVEEVLPRLGVPPNWNFIVRDDFGVPWHRIAPAYQQILVKDRHDTRRQNTSRTRKPHPGQSSASQPRATAEKLYAYVFLIGFTVMVASLALGAVTKNINLAARIFVSTGWLVFAVMNTVAYYTGEFRWKGGPTFTKEQDPIGFYMSWIPFSLGSMGIMTFLVFKAFTEN